MKQDLDVSFGLGVAGEYDFTSVGGGKVDVRPSCQPSCQANSRLTTESCFGRNCVIP